MSLPRVKVQLRLQDKDRTLVLSFNALCMAEEVTNINFLMGENITFSSLRVLRALVWAGLIHEDPNLSLGEAGDMIEEAGADNVTDAIIKAYAKAMPDAKGLPDEDPPKKEEENA